MDKESVAKTKAECLAWLRRNKDLVKVSAIGRKAGIAQLNGMLDGRTDGYGNVIKLADKHVPALAKVIEEIKS